MIIYIYNQQATLVAQPIVSSYEEFQQNPKKFYQAWNSNLIASQIKYTYPILDNGELREKTKYEQYTSGLYKLQDGEIVDGQEIVYLPPLEGLIKPKWLTPTWVESATEEDIFEYNKAFYLKELEYAEKATTEFQFELISPDEFEEVKYYMRGINPYNTTLPIPHTQRPVVFNRY